MYQLIMKRSIVLLTSAVMATFISYSQSFSLNGYGEVYINSLDGDTQVDKPHVLLTADFSLSDKWSFEGEVEYIEDLDITQLWIQRSYSSLFNVKVGKITIPLGFSNTADNPMDHFTAYLPKCEELVIPYDWNQVGFSLLGENDIWQYELLGLVNGNKLAGAAAVNNMSIPNTRVGIDSYYGGTYDAEAADVLFLSCLDYEYKYDRVVSRGNILYSELLDALCGGVEIGYDILPGSVSEAQNKQLFLFSRYDACRITDYKRLTFGINFLPREDISMKAEYDLNLNPSQHGFSLAVGVNLSVLKN